MSKGVVKWYDEIKGFGFIETETEGDVFVHRSGISQDVKALEPGQTVVFETKQGDKGTVAVNVEIEN